MAAQFADYEDFRARVRDILAAEGLSEQYQPQTDGYSRERHAASSVLCKYADEPAFLVVLSQIDSWTETAERFAYRRGDSRGSSESNMLPPHWQPAYLESLDVVLSDICPDVPAPVHARIINTLVVHGTHVDSDGYETKTAYAVAAADLRDVWKSLLKFGLVATSSPAPAP
jgi:hypothetical protein